MNKVVSLIVLLCSCFVSANAGEIIKITASTRHLVPKGKSTDAIDGDWIMKNELVIAVIGNTMFGREANMRVQSVQGAVIDFTSLADNNDYLAAFYPQGYPAEDSRRNPAVFADSIEILKGKGAEIILRAIRNPTDKIPYQSVTEYTLKDGENFLRIKTVYINPGKQNVSLVFADKLRLDMDIRDDVSPLGKHHLAFMYNKWFKAAYGIYREKGLVITEKPKTDSDPGTGLLVAFDDGTQKDTALITLAPGQQVEASRYLMYGKDVAEIQRNVMRFEKTGTVITTLKITDTKKKILPGIFLDIYNDRNQPVSFAITNKAGIAEIPLPAGDYSFRASGIGHDTVNTRFSVTDRNAVVAATMQPLTSIKFTVKETDAAGMLPVKVEFKGMNGTADPFLGTVKHAEGADNLYYAIKNAFEVPLSPGQYSVTLSHGPEYETVTRQINIGRGETKSINAEIKRMFSSPEWVIADFHNHSTRSGDNDVETRSRIINLAGAGIEFAPATEHNRISSYTDEIKKLGLEKYLASAAGIELTGPTGVRGGPNHENAFPLTIQEGKQGGGFPPINGDVYLQVKGLYDYDQGKVKLLQHNHPGIGIPNLFFDKDRDGIIDSGYGTRKFTDVIELQTYVYEILTVTSDTVKNEKAPVFYWLQMLNQGDRIFATMTSDSHITGERNGLRFVYVYSKKDNPVTLDAYEMALSAKKGHMVMSNGPFLKTDINGYLPGDEIKSPAAGLKMNIEVYANNEIEIDRVQVLVNGHQEKNMNFTSASHPELFTKNALQFKHTFPLLLDKDANVIVVATGKKVSPDAKAGSKSRFQLPIAVANPFFIDANGDGFVAGKDTLGEPLPVSPRIGSANAAAAD